MSQESMSSTASASESGWSDDHPVLTVLVTIAAAIVVVGIVMVCVIWLLGG